MLEGIYDLTDDRDFMNDIPDHLAMHGIQPKKLFKPKEEERKRKIKSFGQDFYNFSEPVRYRINNAFTDDTMEFLLDPDDIYNIIGTTSTNWNSYNYFNYDNFHNLSWTSSTSDIRTTITINMDDYKAILKADLPWVRKRTTKVEPSLIKIRRCSYHGTYFSWRRKHSKRNYNYYEECPKCSAEIYFSDELPWSTRKKPEDMPYKTAYLSYDTKYYLARKMQILSGRVPDEAYDELKPHNVPWGNKLLRDLARGESDRVFNTYHDKSIPWYKNMSRRGFREYMEELYEDEETNSEEINPNVEEQDIIDRDPEKMEYYLNMRPVINGGMWH